MNSRLLTGSIGDLVVNPRPDLLKLNQSSIIVVGGKPITTAFDSAMLAAPATGAAMAAATPASPTLAGLTPEVIASQMKLGNVLSLRLNLFSDLRPQFVPQPRQPTPHFVIIERYQLSSYLGNYGAGRTLKTFSLLPGEKTRLSIKTFDKTTSSSSNASSIFDSFTSKSADEFQSSVESERSKNTREESSLDWYVDAEVKGGIPLISGSVKGGASGSTQETREEFAKDISKAASRHAAEASAKRDVKIDTSEELKTETSTETVTEREIQNINLSRTLNFVFRQMNQEFYSILHLTDIRVAFSNGMIGADRIYREVALSQLDSLLEEFVLEEQRPAVLRQIAQELATIYDYADNRVPFVQRQTIDLFDLDDRVIGQRTYLRVNRELVQTYKDPATGSTFNVPGVITAVNKFVMRTDGIIVEALLGQASALDPYQEGLQQAAVDHRAAEAQVVRLQAERERLAQHMINTNDEARADLFGRVFAPAANGHDGSDTDA